MPNYQFIREKDFNKAEPNFISFPESIYNFIQEYKHPDTFVKMQQKIKWKIFDKTAQIYKTNFNVFIRDRFDSNRMYWLYTDGNIYYLVDVRHIAKRFMKDWQEFGSGAIEEYDYVKGTDDDIIHYFVLMGIIKPTMPYDYLYDFHRWKKTQIAINRDRKINQILDEF